MEGQEPARAGSNSGKKAARFLPGVLRAGPDSAAKRLTHSWNNFSSIWKEHMLFLLGEARVWRSFAETCRKRQMLAWFQHPDFQPHAVCWRAKPVGLCSQVQGEKAQEMLVGTSVLGHGASPLLGARCPQLIFPVLPSRVEGSDRGRGTLLASPSSANPSYLPRHCCVLEQGLQQPFLAYPHPGPSVRRKSSGRGGASSAWLARSPHT